MKKILMLLFTVFAAITSVKAQDKKILKEDKPVLKDTVHIENEKLEYDIIIIDPGFSSWFNSYAKPRNFYSQTYLEARNRVWVSEWNTRARNPLQYNSNLYEMQIDYDQGTDYGYEVNYMLYTYLTYFQITNKTSLGGFAARI